MIALVMGVAGATPVGAEGDTRIARGAGSLTLTGWGGPDLPIETYLPAGPDLARAPIVIVMHGVNRDGDRYRDEWIAAARAHGLIIAAPVFSQADFPRAAGYNVGNVFSEAGALNGQSQWSFSAIEPLFDRVRNSVRGQQTDYAIYGHSAGAQFVHRFALFKPDARARLFITANAGWYTPPDLTAPFPYGLAGAPVGEAHVRRALERDVVVLLGDQDTDTDDPNLRRTPEAMAQGATRFERGQYYFEAARATAERLGAPFTWRMEIVEGVGHSNGGMAGAAAAIIAAHAAR